MHPFVEDEENFRYVVDHEFRILQCGSEIR